MAKTKSLPKEVQALVAEKSSILSKALAFAELDMSATARPLWAAAGFKEEMLAPLMETLGRDDEAAVHRMSAASCFMRIGDWSRAANLFRAALGGPITSKSRQEVHRLLKECLAALAKSPITTTSNVASTFSASQN
ncbi:MAG: hypothetical protein L0Y72_22965 [Gemmataceae bacterium]|nr:hypothetical protein [Gemmataceae bacterium]MCI0741905.1 hypothetical protein [Gemmataceae bacterium]